MLKLVAVVPQAPLLVPELAAGAAGDAADLRTACVAAATRLAGAAGRWVAVGAHEGPSAAPPGTKGSFRGFGSNRTVLLTADGSGTPDPELPLPLLIAGWLREVDPAVSVRAALVAPTLPTAGCVSVGRRLAVELAADPEPVGLLVVGDGAATHTEGAPGYFDERAKSFDDRAAAAFAAADPDELLALDRDLATDLGAVGRAPWQVLAAVAGAAGAFRGELLYSAAPYGVAYHVAVWTPTR